MSGRRELNTRCCQSWLMVSFGSNRPRICSNLRIRMVMRDSLVGSRVWRPCLGVFQYCARASSPTGDRGVRAGECDRARWVTMVTKLGAEVLDSSSPPSSPSSWPACHSITSGALGSEKYLWFITGELIFCFLPKLTVSQSLGLSVFRPYNIRRTRPHLFPPQVCRNRNLRLPNAGIRLLGLWC